MLSTLDATDLDAIVPTRNERVIRSRANKARAERAAERNAEWKRLRNTGRSYQEIADAAGVSTNTVYVAINGRHRR